MKLKVNKRVLYTFLSFAVVAIGTLLAIQYAKGNYRLSTDGVARNTGLLSANSFPTGAEVLINDKLVTATDDTIYLEPDEYQVEIRKDGYASWRKTMAVQQELVAQTNARLFPIAPSLSRLTFTGIENYSPSPDGQKILYYTDTQATTKKNGLYILELGSNNLPISLQRGPRQIAEDAPGLSLSEAQYIWAPDSSEVIVITDEKEMLVPIDRLSDLSALNDISFRKKQLLSEWEADMYQRERQFLGEFPEEIIGMATQSAKNVYISPDKERLLYTATASATLAEDLIPAVLGVSSQPEERTLEPGSIYVYDREEDKNFKVGSEPAETTADAKALLALDLWNPSGMDFVASPSAFERLQTATTSAGLVDTFKRYYSSLYTETFQWFPDSRHLLYVNDTAIKVVEYDGVNSVTLYSGPFKNSFVYPWPDGSRLIISTSFSPDAPENLYAIELE